MNLQWNIDVRERDENSPRGLDVIPRANRGERPIYQTELKMRAIGHDMKEWQRAAISEALKMGYETARRRAPRNRNFLSRNEPRSIRDSIIREGVKYHPGGAGPSGPGGGSYTARLYATATIAHHLPFVFEGTGHKQGGGRQRPGSVPGRRGGTIFKAGPQELRAEFLTANKKYFAIQKSGEDVRYRAAVSGQRPRSAWWTRDTRNAMNNAMRERIASLSTALRAQGITSPFT